MEFVQNRILGILGTGGSSGGGGSSDNGFHLNPYPPVHGENLFTGDTLALAQAERDKYFNANTDVLAEYDEHPMRLIILSVHAGDSYTITYENRIDSRWVNTFNQTFGGIDLSTHGFRELRDGRIIQEHINKVYTTGPGINFASVGSTDADGYKHETISIEREAIKAEEMKDLFRSPLADIDFKVTKHIEGAPDTLDFSLNCEGLINNHLRSTNGSISVTEIPAAGGENCKINIRSKDFVGYFSNHDEIISYTESNPELVQAERSFAFVYQSSTPDTLNPHDIPILVRYSTRENGDGDTTPKWHNAIPYGYNVLVEDIESAADRIWRPVQAIKKSQGMTLTDNGVLIFDGLAAGESYLGIFDDLSQLMAAAKTVHSSLRKGKTNGIIRKYSTTKDGVKRLDYYQHCTWNLDKEIPTESDAETPGNWHVIGYVADHDSPIRSLGVNTSYPEWYPTSDSSYQAASHKGQIIFYNTGHTDTSAWYASDGEKWHKLDHTDVKLVPDDFVGMVNNLGDVRAKVVADKIQLDIDANKLTTKFTTKGITKVKHDPDTSSVQIETLPDKAELEHILEAGDNIAFVEGSEIPDSGGKKKLKINATGGAAGEAGMNVEVRTGKVVRATKMKRGKGIQYSVTTSVGEEPTLTISSSFTGKIGTGGASYSKLDTIQVDPEIGDHSEAEPTVLKIKATQGKVGADAAVGYSGIKTIHVNHDTSEKSTFVDGILDINIPTAGGGSGSSDNTLNIHGKDGAGSNYTKTASDIQFAGSDFVMTDFTPAAGGVGAEVSFKGFTFLGNHPVTRYDAIKNVTTYGKTKLVRSGAALNMINQIAFLGFFESEAALLVEAKLHPKALSANYTFGYVRVAPFGTSSLSAASFTMYKWKGTTERTDPSDTDIGNTDNWDKSTHMSTGGWSIELVGTGTRLPDWTNVSDTGHTAADHKGQVVYNLTDRKWWFSTGSAWVSYFGDFKANYFLGFFNRFADIPTTGLTPNESYAYVLTAEGTSATEPRGIPLMYQWVLPGDGTPARWKQQYVRGSMIAAVNDNSYKPFEQIKFVNADKATTFVDGTTLQITLPSTSGGSSGDFKGFFNSVEDLKAAGGGVTPNSSYGYVLTASGESAGGHPPKIIPQLYLYQTAGEHGTNPAWYPQHVKGAIVCDIGTSKDRPIESFRFTGDMTRVTENPNKFVNIDMPFILESHFAGIFDNMTDFTTTATTFKGSFLKNRISGMIREGSGDSAVYKMIRWNQENEHPSEDEIKNDLHWDRVPISTSMNLSGWRTDQSVPMAEDSAKLEFSKDFVMEQREDGTVTIAQRAGSGPSGSISLIDFDGSTKQISKIQKYNNMWVEEDGTLKIGGQAYSFLGFFESGNDLRSRVKDKDCRNFLFKNASFGLVRKSAIGPNPDGLTSHYKVHQWILDKDPTLITIADVDSESSWKKTDTFANSNFTTTVVGENTEYPSWKPTHIEVAPKPTDHIGQIVYFNTTDADKRGHYWSNGTRWNKLSTSSGGGGSSSIDVKGLDGLEPSSTSHDQADVSKIDFGYLAEITNQVVDGKNITTVYPAFSAKTENTGRSDEGYTDTGHIAEESGTGRGYYAVRKIDVIGDKTCASIEDGELTITAEKAILPAANKTALDTHKDQSVNRFGLTKTNNHLFYNFDGNWTELGYPNMGKDVKSLVTRYPEQLSTSSSTYTDNDKVLGYHFISAANSSVLNLPEHEKGILQNMYCDNPDNADWAQKFYALETGTEYMRHRIEGSGAEAGTYKWSPWRSNAVVGEACYSVLVMDNDWDYSQLFDNDYKVPWLLYQDPMANIKLIDKTSSHVKQGSFQVMRSGSYDLTVRSQSTAEKGITLVGSSAGAIIEIHNSAGTAIAKMKTPDGTNIYDSTEHEFSPLYAKFKNVQLELGETYEIHVAVTRGIQVGDRNKLKFDSFKNMLAIDPSGSRTETGARMLESTYRTLGGLSSQMGNEVRIERHTDGSVRVFGEKYLTEDVMLVNA